MHRIVRVPPSLSRRRIIGRRFQSTLVLHSETIDRTKESSTPSTVFLHGLLGNGRNLKTFAKQVCSVQNTTGHLVDLRGHGKSRITKDQHQHSFEACVEDLRHTLASTEFSSSPSTTTMVGHSWGGRVTLQYAATVEEASSPLERIWLLDTVPGQAHKSVEQVINAVGQIIQQTQMNTAPAPTDKKDLVQILTHDYQLDMGIAQWLASSYNSKTADFGFDFEVVQSIIPEFSTQDFYGMLDTIVGERQIRVDLVRGGKNSGWDIATLSKLESIANAHPSKFKMHVLPKAGHWVHVDDLKGLVDLFAKH